MTVRFQNVLASMVLIIFLLIAALNGFTIDAVKSTKRVFQHTRSSQGVDDYFSKQPYDFGSVKVVTNPINLLMAAKDTLRFIEAQENIKPCLVNPASFSEFVSLSQVKKTLHFIISLIEEDRKTGVYRVLNPRFLEKYFGTVVWDSDRAGAYKHNVITPTDGQIYVTTYGVLRVKGSKKRTDHFSCALYQLKDRSVRQLFSKQQIVAGAFETQFFSKKVKTLAWVSRKSLEDALMHGMIVIDFPNGTCDVFHVNDHNCYTFNRNLANQEHQKRYWFFSPIGRDQATKKLYTERVKRRQGVIVAGDIFRIGAGKLFALHYFNQQAQRYEIALSILGDTGGAFENNLYQLDRFGGFFQCREDLTRYLRKQPQFARACVLYRK